MKILDEIKNNNRKKSNESFSMKLIGIVIVYFPDDKIINNILSYLPFLDRLIIWENTPKNARKNIRFEDDALQSKVLKWGEDSNVGIGIPLNKMVEYSIKEGYTHLLTMDQDSVFVENDFEKYVRFIESHPDDASNCILTPNHLVNDSLYYSHDSEFEYADVFITSGTIFPLSIFQKNGLFRHDFFIDVIDTEFAQRAKKNNINIIAIHSVILSHKLGYQVNKHRLLWKVVFPNEYSPIRTYYIIRNGLILFKEYPDPQEKRKYLWYWFYKRSVFIVLYERNKMNKLKALLWGYYHGKKGVVGKQEIFDEAPMNE